MIKNHSFINAIWVLALGAVMSACDTGSVGTSSNPDTSIAASGFFYSGPAAESIDVANFQYYLWRNVIDDSRCGGCHNSQASSPQPPYFFDTANVNVAYSEAITKVDKANPLNSELVTILTTNGGHHCWENISAVCGMLIEGWITDWINASSGGVSARQINLVAPANIRPPGAAKSFPTDPAGFLATVYPLLVGDNPFIGLAQAPFFASGDPNAAYEAAKSKMDIDTPENSRLVQKLIAEQHNCWSNCGTDQLEVGTDARLMRDRIAAFASGITTTSIDPDLVTSMALTLGEGIIASGGNRHETNQFALWEFKAGRDQIAYDTSGVEPAINLALESTQNGSVTWVGGFGLEFSGGRARSDSFSSDKLYTYIQETGKYAIEAWVIPANVTQEDANIVSYSGGDTLRNFTLGQDMYNYEAFNRLDLPTPAPNGDPALTTMDSGEELAQASLQHVVVNYDPLDPDNPGRSIYVNGQLVNAADPVAPGPSMTIAGVWDDTFNFILGNETSGERPWMGQVKMVAIHNQPLTEDQIRQNFDVGVGQKFFLLFYVGHHLNEIGTRNSFIIFEVAQFDSYSYLFNKPTFVNLDGSIPATDINIRGLRIGINGKEALAGQAYANINETVDSGSYDPALGHELSPVGTIISLEKGPDSDEFFLTFEDFNGVTNAFADIVPSVPDDPDDPAGPGVPVESDIGVRTFQEINQTIAEITGVPVTNGAVRSVYNDYIQQLPTVEDVGAFLPSHQMAIAQLALTSCSELVDNNPGFFAPFAFTGAATAFDSPTKRAQVIDPLLTAAMNVDQLDPINKNLPTQPDEASISDLLGSDAASLDLDPALSGASYSSLIEEMLVGSPDTVARTEQIVKAVCAVATGGAVMLVQ
jgi:hypothetical protein